MENLGERQREVALCEHSQWASRRANNPRDAPYSRELLESGFAESTSEGTHDAVHRQPGSSPTWKLTACCSITSGASKKWRRDKITGSGDASIAVLERPMTPRSGKRFNFSGPSLA